MSRPTLFNTIAQTEGKQSTRELQETVNSTSEILKKTPSNLPALRSRGLALYHLGNYEQAARDFTRALAINAADAVCLKARGSVHFRHGSLDKAIEDYTSSLSYAPKDSETLCNRGILYTWKDRYAEAIQDFTAGINNANATTSVQHLYVNRGVAHYKKGDFEKSIADFTTAIELNPTDYQTLKKRAAAFTELERHDEAIEDYTRSVSMNPSDSDSYNNRAMIYNDKNEFDKALSDFNKALEILPDAMTYKNRAALYTNMQQHEAAIQDLTKAISMEPEQSEFYYFRMLNCFSTGELELAFHDLSTVLRLDPGKILCYKYRGSLHHHLQNYQQAIEDYTTFINHYESTTPQSSSKCHSSDTCDTATLVDCYCNRGSAFSILGDYDNAIRDFNRAISLNPNEFIALSNRGSCLIHKGRFEEAITDFDRSIAVDSSGSFANAHCHRAYAVLKSGGSVEGALSSVEKAMQLKAEYAEAFMVRACIRAHQSRFKEANTDLTSALSLDAALKTNPKYQSVVVTITSNQ